MVACILLVVAPIVLVSIAHVCSCIDLEVRPPVAPFLPGLHSRPVREATAVPPSFALLTVL